MTEKVIWRGVRLDPRTRDMMTELARISGSIYINPTQGSWSGAAASAGTHTGCGAVDLMHPSWSVADYNTVVTLARKVGFAAWHRTPQQSNWPRHCHLIAVQKGGKRDRGCLANTAHNQVIDYYEGRNGLASRAPDDGPRTYVGQTWESYLATQNPTDPDPEPTQPLSEGVPMLVYETEGRAGYWLVIPGGDRVWLLSVSSNGAKSWTGPRVTLSNSEWKRLVKNSVTMRD